MTTKLNLQPRLSPAEILSQATHRTGQLPEGPWVGRQSRCDMLLAHWLVNPDILRPFLPDGLDLAIRDGQATLSVVAYSMVDVAPRFVPRALSFTFPQLNLRTYVSYRGNPGIYFFSLDAGSKIAAYAGGWLTKLPYFDADMTHARTKGHSTFASRRRAAPQVGFAADYQAVTEAREKDTPDAWLLERYAFYSLGKDGRLREGNVCHLPWQTCKATAEIKRNTLVDTLSSAAKKELNRPADRLQHSERVDVLFWRPRTIG